VHQVRNAEDFLKKSAIQVSTKMKLSFEVISLFTKIPKDLALDIVLRRLQLWTDMSSHTNKFGSRYGRKPIKGCNVRRIAAYFSLRVVLTRRFFMVDDRASSNCRAAFLPRSAFLGDWVALFFK